MSQQINLFNPIFLKQKKYFSVLAMLQALGLVILGSGIFYGYVAYQVNQLTRQSDETSKRYATEQDKLARYSAAIASQQSGRSLEDELKAAESELAAQQESIGALKSGEIGNTTGYSEYMRAFSRQVVNGLWLTSFSITGDAAQIRMGGGALSPELVPSYIRRLGQERVMQGQAVVTMQIQRGGERYADFSFQSEAGGAARR